MPSLQAYSDDGDIDGIIGVDRRCETCGRIPFRWGEIDRCYECQEYAWRLVANIPRWRVRLSLVLRVWAVWILYPDERIAIEKARKFPRPFWRWAFPS